MGRYTRNTLPLPGWLSTTILPPCWSTILEQMAKPRPTPSAFVVKKGLKMVSMILGSMPYPRSIMEISALTARGSRLHRYRAARGRGLRGVRQQIVEDPLH